jgi:hypothetical protein
MEWLLHQWIFKKLNLARIPHPLVLRKDEPNPNAEAQVKKFEFANCPSDNLLICIALTLLPKQRVRVHIADFVEA